MNILGISALYHDSAAAIVNEKGIIAAAQEERFSRIKHDKSIPIQAIQYCLTQAGTEMEDLNAVVYYDNPILTLERFMNNIAFLGKGCDKFAEKGIQDIFAQRLWIHESLRKKFGVLGKNDTLSVVEHHMSHAASAFYPSPYEDAAIITIDGVGEWATTTIGVGEGNHIQLLKQMNYPHSLGLLYSAFTYFCGFKVNSGDYKFMGLAPYGDPIYYDLILEKIIRVKEDGSFRLNLEYFDFYKSDVMTNDKFADLFGGPRREMESIITKREMDIAASAQKVVESIILKIARTTKKLTGKKNLVMAGGVALNCVANGKLLAANIFDNIWVQPAAGDAGGALGCALYSMYHDFGVERKVSPSDSQQGSYLGPEYNSEQIGYYLEKNHFISHKYFCQEELYEKIADNLKENKIIGLFHGRMEFGPRALGNRSIIANASDSNMQSKINLKIKFRESFRPFAPSVLEEDLENYFEIHQISPYMLFVANVKAEKCFSTDFKKKLSQNAYNMLEIVNEPRSDIPAVTHVDYSARIQSVNQEKNSYYYNILEAYKKKTNCGVIVNTSFNVRGEPIVCTPQEAYECFMRTDMDVLVLENYILYKKEQPEFSEKEDWRKKYELD